MLSWILLCVSHAHARVTGSGGRQRGAINACVNTWNLPTGSHTAGGRKRSLKKDKQWLSSTTGNQGLPQHLGLRSQDAFPGNLSCVTKQVSGKEALASPGNLLKIQTLRLYTDLRLPDMLHRNLHFNKMPRWSVCTLKSGKYSKGCLQARNSWITMEEFFNDIT